MFYFTCSCGIIHTNFKLQSPRTLFPILVYSFCRLQQYCQVCCI